MRPVIGFVFLLVLSGCGAVSGAKVYAPMDSVEIPAPEDTVQALKNAVIAALKDPESARFQEIRFYRNSTDQTVFACGQVNANNGFGGYVGFSPFFAQVVSIANGHWIVPGAHIEGVGDEIERSVWASFFPRCAA